jgi:methylated-DNA-[protein]-cysteine S-methyltransferase
MPREYCVITTKLGVVGLHAEDGVLVRVDLRPGSDTVHREPRSDVLRQAAQQIREYLRGERQTFDVPMRRSPNCTRFQNRVMDALLAIPPGETRTYGELAQVLGTSARAVGGACARNPLPILVPCHRVVAKSGLGGFSGDWETGLALDMKQTLLDLESRTRR